MSEHDAILTAVAVLTWAVVVSLLIYADILLDRPATWAHRRLDQWKEKHGIIWR